MNIPAKPIPLNVIVKYQDKAMANPPSLVDSINENSGYK